MGPGMRLGRYTPIGLDVGCAGMRAIQLAHRAGQWQLHRAAVIQDCPDPSAKQDSRATLDPLRVCRILDLHDFHGTQVVTAMDPPNVALRQVTVPVEVSGRPPEMWMPAVLQELRQHLGVELSGQQVRAWPLPPSRRRQAEVMAVLVPTDQVSGLVTAIDQAGLRCVRVDVGARALVAGALATSTAGNDELWGVLEIGHRGSHLVMALGTTALLHRTLTVGGWQFTHRVAERLKLDPAAAERLRCEHALERSDRALRQNPAEPKEMNVQSMGVLLHAAVRRELRQLAEEIEKSFSYALDAYPNARPVHLVLAGTGSRWRGLDGLLSELLGIKVQVADPAQAWLPPDGGSGDEAGSPSLVRALGLVIPGQARQ